MNPFNLDGPTLLKLYVVLFLSAVGFAIYRRWLWRSGPDLSPEMPDLSPYEVAHLAGDEDTAINAAVARLVHGEILTLVSSGPKNPKLKLHSRGLPKNAAELEKAIYSAVDITGDATVASVRSKARPLLVPIQNRLENLGLLPAENAPPNADRASGFLLRAIILSGVIKIVVGMSRDKPVGGLGLLCILSGCVTLIFFLEPRRTRPGDQVVKSLQKTHSPLKFQASHRGVAEFSGDNMVLALGLFGIDILKIGPLAELQTALKRPSGSGNCGGGCGGDGGGCGGCGGCG